MSSQLSSLNNEQLWTICEIKRNMKSHVLALNNSLDRMPPIQHFSTADFSFFPLCHNSQYIFPHFSFVCFFLIDLYLFSMPNIYKCFTNHKRKCHSMFKPSQRKLFVALSVEIWNIYRFTWENCTNCCNEHRK